MMIDGACFSFRITRTNTGKTWCAGNRKLSAICCDSLNSKITHSSFNDIFTSLVMFESLLP